VKTLFIVNAAAGHGRGRTRFDDAARSLPKGDWTVESTRGPGDASRLARDGVESGYEAIVACGGDGTLGEALNGFMSAPERKRAASALGTWPAGSGCDTARHFGVRGGADGLRALLEDATPRLVDAALVEYRGLDGSSQRRWFVNVASFGVAGEVARRMETTGKPLGGTLSYLLASVGALLSTPARDIRLVADGRELPRGRYHLVSVANTSTTGGGMKIAPGADAEDGRLDLVAVGDLPRARLLRSFPALYRGEHLKMEGVSHRLVGRLEASSEAPVYLNIDGEAAGLLPAVFTALPRAVRFLLPGR
jgi:YegS/Rv2252/BmrU family lipid kinase